MADKQEQQDAKTNQIMADITQRVIDAIASGTAPWQKPWENRHGAAWPTNLQTGKHYRGLNAFYLMMLGDALGSNYWIGCKQARKLGGNVRKGEKSTAILAPITRKYKCKETGDDKFYVAGFRVVRVFHVSQCDGLTVPSADTFEPRTIDASMLDEFAIATGAVIEHGETDRACYVPALDVVRMPAKDQFNSAGGYYGTLLHELIHWTGHSSRLDRLGDKNLRGYAFEELIAELGAYYASELIGCPNAAENHASYLESWLKALANDPKYLWQAASRAEKAAEYLVKLGQRETAHEQAA